MDLEILNYWNQFSDWCADTSLQDVWLGDINTNVHEETQPWVVLLCPTSKIASPIFAGDMVTTTPASFSASIFASAPPLPPAMIAPACPRRGRGREGRKKGVINGTGTSIYTVCTVVGKGVPTMRGQRGLMGIRLYQFLLAYPFFCQGEQ